MDGWMIVKWNERVNGWMDDCEMEWFEGFII